MGFRKLMSYTIVPAAVGAGAGFIAQKMGYDISALDGMRQLVMAGLPWAALEASFPKDNNYNDYNNEFDDYAADHPYLAPALSALGCVALFSVGGVAMEAFSRMVISQPFTAVAGGLTGMVEGMISSTKSISS